MADLKLGGLLSPQKLASRGGRGRTWSPHILLVCLGLFALALLARLYRLDAQSLWLDEGSSWELSRAGWGFLLGELLNPSAAYPLYHLLLKGWMALFGDSEAALRMPSALAGALAVPAIYMAARELERLRPPGGPGDPPGHGSDTPFRLAPAQTSPPGPLSPDAGAVAGAGSGAPGLAVSAYGLAAAALVALAPYAIWYSQEAKVYSLLLLVAALWAWALARALRTGRPADWGLALAVGLGGVFVHRLAALLLVAGLWAAAALLPARPGRAWRAGGYGLGGPGSGLLVAGVGGGAGGAGAGGRSEAGAAIPAGPGLALGLTFVRFSVDRWPGDAPWWWLLPWALLAAWGLARALADLRDRRARPRALLLLLLLLVPTGLFLAQLLFTRLYEARYLTVAYPAWALLLAYPLAEVGRRAPSERPGPHPPAPSPQRRGGAERSEAGVRWTQTARTWAYGALFGAALLTGGLALFQPVFGLFSGDPVKEQYREAVAELAARVHPDDAVVLHPSYLRPLYAYYMGRLTADPAPEPLLFGDFWQGETDYGQREWDIERRARLAGYTRSFLLIAPDHARTVDRPRPGDEYGLVGNFWAYSREQRAWPCGIWRYNGAHLLCQEAPEPYYTGAPAPAPATPVGATFGEHMRLLGYTMKATTPAGPGVYRAGGTLPISLFWDVGATPEADYSLFLHLCRRCDVPPAAGEDGPPLEGYLPTSSWLPGKPARDDRAIALPADMPPGRYTLLLGLYDPADPSEAGRLRVSGGERMGDDRLVLGAVEIVPADAALAAGAAQP